MKKIQAIKIEFSPDIELSESEFIEVMSQCEENIDSINYDSYWLVWFKGRNTSTVVQANDRNEAISKARARRVAGSDGEIVSARQAKNEEISAIKNGKWLRIRANGSTNSNTGSFIFRPHLKNKAKGNNVGV